MWTINTYFSKKSENYVQFPKFSENYSDIYTVNGVTENLYNKNGLIYFKGNDSVRI
jgi:hypothetical protein